MRCEIPPQSAACSPNRSVSVSSLNVVSITPARVQPTPRPYASARPRPFPDTSWCPPEPVLSGPCPAVRALVEPGEDVLSGVLEVQRVGVALAAVADDRDLPALEQAEVGVLVVVDLRGHRVSFPR